MPEDVEGQFYRFLQRTQQADPTWNRSVLEHYVPMFAHCAHVLDVGCGEGQFLRLLQERDSHACGVDLDKQMVEQCIEQGLDVVQEDAFDYLGRHKASFDGVFCSNLIEHLCASDVLRLLQLCLDSLHPGGLLVVATPNAASAIVQLYEFWRDATHVRLYSPSLVEFLLDYVGFVSVRSAENPVTAWSPPADIQDAPRIMDQVVLSPRASQRPLASVLNPPTDAPHDSLKGLIFRLRRSLARFLARRVLFEEFDAVERELNALREQLDSEDLSMSRRLTDLATAAQQLHGPLYRTYGQLLAVPREIWAAGIKPLRDTQEAQ